MDLGVVIISFVQGIGELLPVSSSVNMLLFHNILNTEFFNFSFKMALHVGSLFALLIYFRKEIADIFKAIFTKKKTINETYLIQLIAGTIPVVILGYLSRDFIKEFNNYAVMGFFCVFFGLLLFVVDKISCSLRRMDKTTNISISKAFVIGIFQSVALLPGVSRLGICITASRMMSLDRRKAIFFSLFLAIPSILGGLCLEIHEAITSGSTQLLSSDSMIGMGLTALISMIVIVPCVKFMEKKGFFAIAIYRCVIGLLIFKLDFFAKLFF